MQCYFAGNSVFPVRSIGWCSVGCLGPETISYSDRQLYMCTSATDEDKSYVRF